MALVGATGEALSTIVTRIDEISAAVSEIAKSAAQQSSSLQHLSAAATEMDRMTQQNAAMVEQSNAAARQLADQSGQLAQLVAAFRLSREAPVSRVSRASAVRPQAAQPVPAAKVARVTAQTGSAAAIREDWSEF